MPSRMCPLSIQDFFLIHDHKHVLQLCEAFCLSFAGNRPSRSLRNFSEFLDIRKSVSIVRLTASRREWLTYYLQACMPWICCTVFSDQEGSPGELVRPPQRPMAGKFCCCNPNFAHLAPPGLECLRHPYDEGCSSHGCVKISICTQDGHN